MSSFIEKLPEIQLMLREMNADGWLLCDFRQSNIFAYRILDIPETEMKSRKFYYFIPAHGEPKKLSHRIEFAALDHLPGEKTLYSTWSELQQGIQSLLRNVKNVAMEYSPNNNIPYVSKVDAGTIEFIRSFGVEVLSSANLVAAFEARWTQAQLEENLRYGKIFRTMVDEIFGHIGERIRSKQSITEFQVQEFIKKRFDAEGMFTDHGPNCSINANSANPHYNPTAEGSEEIKQGDLVLVDFWAKKNHAAGTYVDITWMAFVGNDIPEKYVKGFDVICGARDAAISFVEKAFKEKRSIAGFEIDDVSRSYITERGYGEYFVHRTGHSIGTEVHGNGANIDNYETKDERIILPMTSFSIEPGIYLPGDYGMRTEVDIVIDADSNVIVTTEPRQKVLIKILA